MSTHNIYFHEEIWKNINTFWLKKCVLFFIMIIFFFLHFFFWGGGGGGGGEEVKKVLYLELWHL